MTNLQQDLLVHSQHFEALLQQEWELLRDGGSADALQALAEQKMDCSQQLEILDRYRREHQSASPNDELLNCLRRCRDLNERIGRLLARRADDNEQAMQVLGISSAPLRTYNADGQHGANALSRRLGEA